MSLCKKQFTKNGTVSAMALLRGSMMTVKIRARLTLAGLSLLGLNLVGVVAAPPALATDVYVIANPSVTINTAELRDIYLGEKQFSGSIKMAPVDNAAIQGDFLAKALNFEASKYASLWTKKGFRGGLAAPTVKSGDAEVISFVKSTIGAVGYISSPPPPGVVQLFKY